MQMLVLLAISQVTFQIGLCSKGTTQKKRENEEGKGRKKKEVAQGQR